ncbi:MAG: hypothetical protein H0U73_00040 [Tatlockia sp.]|nr:hypothetical protein [Tatlockia sp.]
MRISFISCLSGLIISVHSSAMSIKCPEEIKTKQSLQQEIKGWNPFINEPSSIHHFNRITFYAGHPKENASLAPDNERKDPTWTFDANDIWLACGYLNTNIQLIQKLPTRIKKCKATYSKDFSKVIAVHCF